MALKNLFGDLVLDTSFRALLRLLGRTSYTATGALRVILAEPGPSAQPVSGTLSISGQSVSVGYQQSQDNFNIGYRTRIRKT